MLLDCPHPYGDRMMGEASPDGEQVLAGLYRLIPCYDVWMIVAAGLFLW